jgi:molybdopterin biosynthesis enzyme
VALAALVNGVEPVIPVELPLVDALRCIAADMPRLGALPPYDIAAVDGYAFCARDLVGASSYSPLPLAALPAWVEAGEAIPEGCDCVLDSDSIDQSGPMPLVLAEAIPGQGVRRAGGDIAAGSHVAEAGRRVLARDLLIARAAGIKRLKVRRPRLRLVNIPGGTVTSDLIAESARTAGADVIAVTAAGRDAASIAAAIDVSACDLLLMVGGSGVGRTDATVMALRERGEILAHGIAMQPGRTSAVGRVGKTPVVAQPGRPDQAFAAWWTLALPVLDRLSDRRRARRSPCRWRARSIRCRHRRSSAAGAEAGRLGDTGGRGTVARCDCARRGLADRARGCGRICCGHRGRCLYAAGMIWIPA